MAVWKTKTVKEVVQAIDEGTMVLPVIQRNLVWSEEKIVLLFDSLLRRHSFGGIMTLEDEKGNKPLFAFRRFSRTGEYQESQLKETLDRTILLIIDGQQRLQAFYMGLTGGINGKELYFNLFSGSNNFEFQFTTQEGLLEKTGIDDDGARQPKCWYSTRNLYTRILNAGDDTEVAQGIVDHLQLGDEKLNDRIQGNVGRFFKAVFVYDVIGLSMVTVNKSKPDEERTRMVELFRRLNDGGTRLSALDLAAATLKGFDYRLENFLRKEIPQFSDIGFQQDEVIKLLFLLRDDHKKDVLDITQEDADFAVNNSRRIIKTLELLRKILKYANLYDYYQNSGRSVIPLYFLAYHIFHKSVNTEDLGQLYLNYDINNADFTNIKCWLYLSLLTGVFSRGHGWIPYQTGIRKILDVIKRYKNGLFPVAALFQVYENHPLTFSREISTKYLSSWDLGFVFYLMYGCQSLAGRDIDHIQPRSLLEGCRVPPEAIHSIGNFQLLTPDENRDGKRAKELKIWLANFNPAIREAYLERHLIPEDPRLWALTSFNDLLAVRSEKIVHKISSMIPNLPDPPANHLDLNSDPSPTVENPRLSASWDREQLLMTLPEECRNHPILTNPYEVYRVFAENTRCGKAWTNRYRREMAHHQIITFADFALLIMALGLKKTYKDQYGDGYTFVKPLPDGSLLRFNTRHFGTWPWGIILRHLKSQEFDWTEYLDR